MRHKVRRVHFVGVGGVGMSGLAEILNASGYAVTGSDLRDGAATRRMRELGIRVAIGHAPENVGEADVVVVSSAIPARNPEVEGAERRHIPVIARAELLAELMRLKYGVAIAGSHGKTTTTSLVGAVLQNAGLDPTIIVGGRVKSLGANSVLGAGDILVAEADESDGSFLRLMPTVVVVTSIDREHLDHYGEFAELKRAFADFANRVPFWGAAVLCLDDPRVREILASLDRRTRTYGLTAQAQVSADEVRGAGFQTHFRAVVDGHRADEIRLRMPGRHNVANALAAIAVGLEFDVPFARIRAALEEFGGVERRFEVRGERDGVLVVDDYSHNAAKVRAALEAARQIERSRVIVAYQPHRYTRTRDQFEELADAFHDADTLVLTEIYAAGEPKIPGVEAAALAAAIRIRGHRDVQLVPDVSELAARMSELTRPGDLLVFMGAGDITRQADAYLQGGDPD